MSVLYIQGFNCEYTADHDHYFLACQLPITDPKQLILLDYFPDKANNHWVGVCGDINVVYGYDQANTYHVAEKDRLSLLYDITEGENTVTISADYDNYSPNMWYEHAKQNEQWVSIVLPFKHISSKTKDVVMYRFVTEGFTSFKHIKLANTTQELTTPLSNQIFIMGDDCLVTSQDKAITHLRQKPETIETIGNTSFTTTGTCYIVVAQS